MREMRKCDDCGQLFHIEQLIQVGSGDVLCGLCAFARALPEITVHVPYHCPACGWQGTLPDGYEYELISPGGAIFPVEVYNGVMKEVFPQWPIPEGKYNVRFRTKVTI